MKRPNRLLLALAVLPLLNGCGPEGGNTPVPAGDAAEGGITPAHGVPVNSASSRNASRSDRGSDSPAPPFGTGTSPQPSFGQPSAAGASAFGQPALNPNPGGGSESDPARAPGFQPN